MSLVCNIILNPLSLADNLCVMLLTFFQFKLIANAMSNAKDFPANNMVKTN